MGNKISYYQHNFLDCQRCPDIKPEWIYVIWTTDGYSFHAASFKTESQLKAFAKKLGFTYEWTSEREDGYKEGFCSHNIFNHAQDEEPLEKWRSYYNKAFFSGLESSKKLGRKWLENHFEDIHQAYDINPKNLEQAHKFKCLSNGSIVDGFFTNDGKTIKIYRCNPNAKKFYKPLSTEKHIAYQRKHGVC